jgi:hypothetical protein
LLVLAGIFTSLAILTTYQSFSLLPLLFLYAWLQRRITLKNMAPLGAALLVFGAIILFYFLETGGPPKLSYSIGLNLTPVFIANKILATVSVIGGAIVFPVLLIAGLLKGKKEYLAFAALFAILFLFFLTKVASGQYTLISAILQVVFYSAGLLAFYRFFNVGADAALSRQGTEKDNDSIFLILWICGVLVYNIVLLPYASTRYLLPLFPPVILMFVGYARTLFPVDGKWARFAIAAVICTAVTGLATSIADYRLSGVYRDFASSYTKKFEANGHRVWFAGEFGLRYYLEENGGRYLTRQDNSPTPGDHVILSHDLVAHYISDDLNNRLVLEQRIDYPNGWPVRVQDIASQAGFYDQFHGNLPYSISSEPIESIDI